MWKSKENHKNYFDGKTYEDTFEEIEAFSLQTFPQEILGDFVGNASIILGISLCI